MTHTTSASPCLERQLNRTPPFTLQKMRTAVNERWVHTRGCVEDHATFASLLCGTSEEDNNLQVYNNSLRKPTGSTSSGSKYSGSKHSGSKWSSWSGSTWTKWSGTKSKSGKTRSRKKSKSHPQVRPSDPDKISVHHSLCVAHSLVFRGSQF